MLLAVNIGNSNIRFGVFKEEGEIVSWVVNTHPYRTEDECYAKFKGMYKPFGFDKKEITEIVVGSVVPQMTAVTANSLRRIHRFSPVVVDRYTPSGISHSSHQMGTDIYANAVAAHKLHPGNNLVIDFGTALTFVSVDQSGQVGGAVIAPGVETALRSLIGKTAQLTQIELKKPEKVLGMTTETCMQSGLVNGYICLVEGMIDKIDEEMGEKNHVIATGGMAQIYAPFIERIDVTDVFHTLKGLKILYEENH